MNWKANSHQVRIKEASLLRTNNAIEEIFF